MPGNDPDKDLLCAVVAEDEIALVRVFGRGCFANSSSLKQFSAHVQKCFGQPKFIVDLHHCDSMDSTFMGVLAHIAVHQLRSRGPRTVVVNASDHCQRLLKNLGIGSIIDLRSGSIEEVEKAEDHLRPAEPNTVSRAEQICLTLQAHKELVNLDSGNEVRFQAVIEYLEKSLEEEKKGNDDTRPKA